MRFYDGLPAMLFGTAVISAIVVTQSNVAVALTGEEVNNIARDITVLIDGVRPGSGAIIARDGNSYYVLTAFHVVKTEDEYTIITPDRKAYKVEYSKVKRLPGLDLAVVEFTSSEEYKTARLANSDMVKEGSTVFVSGWPNPGREIKERIRQTTTGQVSARPNTALADGYAMVYTNVTRAGMSGGPVLDSSGRLVGIHGRAEGEDPEVTGQESGPADSGKVGFNLAIPINSFLRVAPQAGVDLSLRAENSPPTELTAAYTPPAQPDRRDRISDISRILGNINGAINTIQRIRRGFPF